MGHVDHTDAAILALAALHPARTADELLALDEFGELAKSTVYRRVAIMAVDGRLEIDQRRGDIGRPANAVTITPMGRGWLAAHTLRLRAVADRLSRSLDPVEVPA